MTEKLNVLLIIIDALRAGNLPCYGYSKNTAPTIDKISRNAVVFEDAYSTTNSTDISLTSIMTGYYPATHGIRAHGAGIPREFIADFTAKRIRTLPEYLRDAGYRTYGIDWLGRWHTRGFDFYLGLEKKTTTGGMGERTSSPSRLAKNILRRVTKALPDSITHSRKLSSLRRRYMDLLSPILGSRLTERAIATLKQNGDKPFFMLIHYWDTHIPYRTTDEIYEEFKPSDIDSSPTLEEISRNWLPVRRRTYLNYARILGIRTVAEMKALYDAAIRYVDNNLQKLFTFMQDAGIYDNTLIIITSDHGESLDEHGVYFAHHTLYDPTIHVPLIIVNLNEKGKRVKGFVQHVDLVPTILETLGMDVKIKNLDGTSLVPFINSGKSDKSFIIVEEAASERKLAIRTHIWKHIYAPDPARAVCKWCRTIHGGEQELYNLRDDPAEIKNIVEHEEEVAKELRSILDESLRSFERKGERLKLMNKIRKMLT